MSRKREKRKQSGHSDKKSQVQYVINGRTFMITLPGPRSVTVTTASSPASDSSTTAGWDPVDWNYTWIEED